MEGFKSVKTYLYRHQAEEDRVWLEAYGITAFVAADDAGGALGGLSIGMNNVRLLVFSAHVAKAQELLKTLDD